MGELSGRPVRIAMVAPPWFEVPPQGYDGIEAVCAGLVDRLVARGHWVTLIGAGRDRTAAKFVATFAEPPSVRLGEPVPEVLHSAAVAQAVEDVEADLVHDHTLAGPLLAAGRPVSTVVTAHGPVDGDLGDYYRQLGGWVGLVAISDAQRRIAPDLPWLATVYNGIDVDAYPFREAKDDFVLFLGRFSPDKGAHLAIDAARPAGRFCLPASAASRPSGPTSCARSRLVWGLMCGCSARRRRRPSGSCCRGPPVWSSGLLGGAVRDGADRGVGVWDAGGGAAARIGARDRH
jgi:hypothetical protein